MYQIPAASARSLWQTIAGMSEYTLSEADRIRMREEVIRKDNCLCAALSIRRYLLMAVMVYQHQAGSRLRPSEPAYASTFGFGGASSGYRQASAEDIAPQVLSREEIAGLRGRGYSLLDENAWNRLIALLRIIRLNEERIADVASLRRQMLDMTPGELASRGFDDLLWRHVSREPVA